MQRCKGYRPGNAEVRFPKLQTVRYLKAPTVPAKGQDNVAPISICGVQNFANVYIVDRKGDLQLTFSHPLE